MTRTEAEHLLDAYKLTADLYGNDAETAKALKEVILDAMASTTYYPITIGNPTPSKPVTTPWTIPTWVSTTASMDGSAQEVDA